jgi:hypothetical protein
VRIGLAAWRSSQSRAGPGAHALRGLRHCLAQGPRIVALDLHQQDGLRGRETVAHLGVSDEVEEGAIQQLDRRGLAGEQRGHHLDQIVQRAQLHAESRPVGGLGVESPVHSGDEPQSAFRADEEVEQVA